MTETSHAMPAARETPSEQARNPWLVLLVLCTAIFMLLLDTTIVNVAQRKIQVDLNASLTQIQWVLDSYILTYAVLLLSFGRMGDVFGRKRLFIVGMAIFTAASALCAASNALGDALNVSGVNVLIWSRVLQGFGGAFMMPQTLSLLTVVFPPEKRGAAMGIWGGIVALGAVIGPVVGGLIVTNYAWEWVFLINVPIGIASILATIAIIPESTDPRASKRLDWAGLFLSGFGIFALVYAMIEAPKVGWTSTETLLLSFTGILLLVIFIWWERRARDPMMKIELFAHRNFWAGNLVSLLVAFGMLGIFFPMTLFLQGALGFSPIRAGLTMTPMSLMIMIAAPIAGRLTDRIGARWILATGLTFMTAGVLFLRSRISLETDWQGLLPALIVTGTGMGLTFAPMTTAVMAEVPPRIAGSASGILNTMRNIGQVMGIAVLGSVLSSQVAAHAGDQLDSVAISDSARQEIVRLARDSRFEDFPAALQGADAARMQATFAAVQQAFVDSLQNTFLVGAGACAVALAVAFLMRNPARQPAAASAPRREPGATAVAAD
ncbi:MAG TPA: DHA2 family efflux MFS transporter permease subunit [Thermomicrobiales bacterium]|nr:DHA2 family efflux MFS transporter permease subunit [Thermomicrobiales bacterium]